MKLQAILNAPRGVIIFHFNWNQEIAFATATNKGIVSKGILIMNILIAIVARSYFIITSEAISALIHVYSYLKYGSVEKNPVIFSIKVNV